jgi:hypothetical protein
VTAARTPRLTLLTGYRELLLPLPLDRGLLGEIVERAEPGAFVPGLDWARPAPSHPSAPPPEMPPYHTLLHEAAGGDDRRLELFFDYVEAAAAPGRRPVVVLPYERLVAEDAPHDTWPRRFLARAQARFGVVQVRRLELSRRSTELIRRLAAKVGLPLSPSADPAAAQVAPTAAATPGTFGTPGTPGTIDVEAILGPGPASDALAFNLNHAILAIGERLVAGTSVFRARASRAAEIAADLAGSGLRLDLELGVDRVLAELERGGELWRLLVAPTSARAAAARAP